jgi:ABC-type uncharacterized transport system YnjBCD ATPase subunit
LNLPQPATPFVGRQIEVARLTNLLFDPAVRLITIMGPGGMGKSRLAIEAARAAAEQFDNGVTFVELAALGDSGEMIAALAQALGFQFQGKADQHSQLLGFLAAIITPAQYAVRTDDGIAHEIGDDQQGERRQRRPSDHLNRVSSNHRHCDLTDSGNRL